MELAAAVSLLVIAISLTSLVARLVLAPWLMGSRSTRKTSPPELSESTVLRRLAELEADQVALSSTQEKLCTTVKRLTSRAGMREHRLNGAESSAAPPVGTSKAELLRHYGMSGKVGPDFARAQQELELRKPN